MNRAHFCTPGSLAAFLLLGSLGHPAAQDLWLTGVSIERDGTVRVQYTARATNYYTLFRGDSVTIIDAPTAMTLGQDGIGQLADPAATVTSQCAFYRVGALPLGHPQDTDGDGLDDVAELTRGTNPLDGDSDADGWDDGVESADHTDPLDPHSLPRSTITAAPPMSLTIPHHAEHQPLSSNWTLAQPPTEIIVPSLGEIRSNFGSVTLANPPAAVITPAGTEAQRPSGQWTIALPPVELLLPPCAECDPMPNGPWLGLPSIAVSMPPQTEAALPTSEWTVSHPLVAMVLPWAGEADVCQDRTTRADPPVVFRWISPGPVAAPP